MPERRYKKIPSTHPFLPSSRRRRRRRESRSSSSSSSLLNSRINPVCKSSRRWRRTIEREMARGKINRHIEGWIRRGNSAQEYILITGFSLARRSIQSHPRIKVEISSDGEGEVADKQMVAGKTDNYPGWSSPLFTYRRGGQWRNRI